MTGALQQTQQRQAHLDEQQLAGIRAAVRGQICVKGSPGYDEARTIWNAMIDRYPDVVIRCAEAADVIQAVRFANEHDVTIAVRGGGHNIAGNAVGEGGLLIDLSPMKMVRVDPPTQTASVGPGATLADVDKETQAFALALPTGINSTTGIAGLTLGGGFGWLTRPFGMTIDNLISVDVVTAKGELVRASGSQNEDLFWAIRGGGGNSGSSRTSSSNCIRSGRKSFPG
jgi:FAD/FMN-containing dehydrogenase